MSEPMPREGYTHFVMVRAMVAHILGHTDQPFRVLIHPEDYAGMHNEAGEKVTADDLYGVEIVQDAAHPRGYPMAIEA